MKHRSYSFLLLALLSPALFAGQVTFTGTGRVSSAPNYIELTLTVASECYKTPSAARLQTDLRVAKIVALLTSKLNSNEPRDTVLANGGFSSPFSRISYSPDGTRQTVCEGTFQKITTVTMKTSNVAGFATDFDDIQEQVLAEFTAPTSDLDKPMTYVSIGTPQPQLYHETMEADEKTALAAAFTDAIAKLEATFGACPITSYDVASYTDAAEPARDMAYATEAAHAGGGSPTPVSFDDIWTRRTLKVQFAFEGGRCNMKR